MASQFPEAVRANGTYHLEHHLSNGGLGIAWEGRVTPTSHDN